MRPNRNRMPLVLLLLALLVGCKKEEAPAPAPEPAPAQPKPAAPVQKQLSSAVRPGGALDFSRRTDPFKPFVVAPPAAPAAGPSAPSPGGPPPADLLPIQSYEASKFKVAGIIAGLDQNRALVLDPTGKGYVVQAGMEIGNAGGRISRITANSVEVVERYKESGRTKTRTIVLTLAKKR